MGRLHRHDRKRPAGFDTPCVQYSLLEVMGLVCMSTFTQDVAVLWRTRELLKRKNNKIVFLKPIENVLKKCMVSYGMKNRITVIGKSCAFEPRATTHVVMRPKYLLRTGMNPLPTPTKMHPASLVERPMALSVVPALANERKKALLDGESISAINDFERDELLNMNTISVPAGWKWLPSFEDGYIYLPMRKQTDGWFWANGKYSLKYTIDFGFRTMGGGE